MSRISQQRAKAYNLGREDALQYFETKRVEKCCASEYKKGYASGVKDRGKKQKVPKKTAKRVFWILLTLLVILSYNYYTEYLCSDSPVIPMRCKSFPWEE